MPPDRGDKSTLRALHSSAVEHRIERARKGLERHEQDLLGRLARPSEIDLSRFAVKLIPVQRKSSDELLFRWAALHWSIPVSSGYGRRLRFLIEDQANQKLVGLIGLGDPVFSLRDRDSWIGWSAADRRQRLVHVADAFVLGAVPPYSALLGGKLAAMLAASNEVQIAWREKYGGRESLISGDTHDGRLAMITTASALGRSSIYNRLNFGGSLLFRPVGFTKGSGDFHFSDGLHGVITSYALEHCMPSAKDPRWGTGFRNRREIVKKALKSLGLPTDLMYHGVERQLFVVPMATNSRRFLRGKDGSLDAIDRPAQVLVEHFKNRWMLPRASRSNAYKDFDPNSWKLWDRPPQTHSDRSR